MISIILFNNGIWNSRRDLKKFETTLLNNIRLTLVIAKL